MTVEDVSRPEGGQAPVGATLAPPPPASDAGGDATGPTLAVDFGLAIG